MGKISGDELTTPNLVRTQMNAENADSKKQDFRLLWRAYPFGYDVDCVRMKSTSSLRSPTGLRSEKSPGGALKTKIAALMAAILAT